MRSGILTVTKPTRTFLSFSILSIIYILLLLLLPPNAATIQNYHLSNVEYRVLSLLLGLPRIIVWFAAFYGYSRLDQYSQAIKKTADGRAFEKIGDGLRWLAWGLPISAVIANLAGGIAHTYPSTLSASTIIVHYVDLIISVVAFVIISGGTWQLVEANGKGKSIEATRIMMFSFIFLAIGYCYATIRTVQTQAINPYRMPMWLILLTIVIPYLFAWLMGLLASYEISHYRSRVAGVLYKRALTLLANGLGLAIISSVVLQYITASSTYLRRIEFNWSLLVVYVVLVLYAAGFTLIAIGANKLKKIEEV